MPWGNPIHTSLTVAISPSCHVHLKALFVFLEVVSVFLLTFVLCLLPTPPLPGQAERRETAEGSDYRLFSIDQNPGHHKPGNLAPI